MNWIIIQAVLFGILIFLPYEADFGIPNWLLYVGDGLIMIGFLILVRAVFDLRKSLAIAPAPKEDGQLQIHGIYGHIRHPMYVAVWLILGPGAITSGSYSKIMIFTVLVIFFIIKTRHEEKLLAGKYEGYGDYMKSVGAYIPKI